MYQGTQRVPMVCSEKEIFLLLSLPFCPKPSCFIPIIFIFLQEKKYLSVYSYVYLTILSKIFRKA